MNLFKRIKQLLHITQTDKELTFKNLILLENHWEKCRGSVTFVMGTFKGIDNLTVKEFILTGEDTVKCWDKCSLIGLSPEVLKIDVEKHFDEGVFNYNKFSKTHFPYLYSGDFFNNLGLYLFLDAWPNDLDHALTRIERVVNEEVDKNICIEKELLYISSRPMPDYIIR